MELLPIKGAHVHRGYRAVVFVAALVTALTTFAQSANAAITPARTTWEWPGYDWGNPPFQGIPPADFPTEMAAICMNAHLAGIGWAPDPTCVSFGSVAIVGTTGQRRRM